MSDEFDDASSVSMTSEHNSTIFLLVKEIPGRTFTILPDNSPEDWEYIGDGSSNWDELPNEYQFSGPFETMQAFADTLNKQMQRNVEKGKIHAYLINNTYSIQNPLYYSN